MIVRCQQQAAACRKVCDLIGLAARRSSDARRRYPVTCGCTVRKHGRRYLIEVKPIARPPGWHGRRKNRRCRSIAPGNNGAGCSVPTNLYGYIALRRKDGNKALAFHDCRPMAAAGPRVRHPQQRREANAKRHHSDDQFPRGHTGFPVEFLSANAVIPKRVPAQTTRITPIMPPS